MGSVLHTCCHADSAEPSAGVPGLVLSPLAEPPAVAPSGCVLGAAGEPTFPDVDSCTERYGQTQPAALGHLVPR